MILCIIVPSNDYMLQAGVRIRYERIRDQLGLHGIQLELNLIDSFQSQKSFVHDIYLFSKCYDTRSYLVAKALRNAGKITGVDFFDDYFSQLTSSRFLRLRGWLRTMAGLTDFYLCSTQRMAEVVSTYLPGVYGHVMNDPYDEFNAEAIAKATTAKVRFALETRCLRIAWFGIGDNPHFNVGLHDLYAYSDFLNELKFSGFSIELSILTNRRALNRKGLDYISQLPVPCVVDEWSTEKEAELLSSSLAAFIPVNAQTFSIAKSMNRAITTLTSGTQVLSAGYPLYNKIHGFIYRSATDFLGDLERNALQLRAETTQNLKSLLDEHASIEQECTKLAGFLSRLTANPPLAAPGIFGIIHGNKSSSDFHKFAQKLGHLSVSSPFSSEKLNYDIRFIIGAESNSVEVQFEKKILDLIPSIPRKEYVASISPTGRSVMQLGLETRFPDLVGDILPAMQAEAISLRLATYERSVTAIQALLSAIIPGVELTVSERDPLYSMSGRGDGTHSPSQPIPEHVIA